LCLKHASRSLSAAAALLSDLNSGDSASLAPATAGSDGTDHAVRSDHPPRSFSVSMSGGVRAG
jgi:hypothetical protein